MSGVSVGTAQGCSRCVLKVGAGMSTASARLRRAGSKLSIRPSMPFQMSFNDISFSIGDMSLYHPSPVRIENVQHDAMLSLNSDTHIVLVPLKGVSVGSEDFIAKIASFIPAMLDPDTPDTNVPTGSDWTLDKIFKVGATCSGDIQVMNSFFQWIGKQAEKTSGPMYILLQEPVEISALDMASINMLPATPVEKAIHPIPKVFTYKPAACESKAKAREKFTSPKEECNPLALLSQQQTQTLDSKTIMNILLGIVSGIAVFIGVYFALKYATGPVGNFFKNLGEKIGRAASGVDKELSKLKLPDETAFSMVNPMKQAPSQSTPKKPQPSTDIRKTQRTLQGYRNPRLQTRRQIPADKPKPLENEQINPMRLTQEQRQQIKKEEPVPQEPDIRKPAYIPDARKTQRTLQTFKAPVRQRTMKNKEPVKTTEAAKEEIAKLEQDIKDVAGTGLLTPEEMKIPPEQRRLFNGKVVKRRIIAEETPDEDIQELKDLVSQKEEAEKKLQDDKEKRFKEYLAADREKVEALDEKIREQKKSVREMVQLMKRRRRNTTRAILEEARRRKKETEQPKSETKLFGPLPKGRNYPIGYRGKTQ